MSAASDSEDGRLLEVSDGERRTSGAFGSRKWPVAALALAAVGVVVTARCGGVWGRRSGGSSHSGAAYADQKFELLGWRFALGPAPQPPAAALRRQGEPAEGRDGGNDEWPTATEAVKKMGLGINFGQKFEDKFNRYWRYDYKSWIDGVKAAGFTHVRIPVTWGDHLWKKESQVNRVKGAVQYALSKGLWVLINTHHEFWLKDHYDDQKHLNDKFQKLWTDIATLFKDSPSKLVFEVLNEPEHKFGSVDGDYRKPSDAKAKQLTRKINALGLDAIRKVSPKRVVFISPNSQSNANQLRNIYGEKRDLPHGGKDRYLGVTIHTYDPWGCCGQDGNNGQCWQFWNKDELPRVNFDDIAEWSNATGVPVHWGEFGIGRYTQRSRGAEIVKDYYRKVVAETLKRGQSPCVWDDMGWFAVSTGSGNWTHGLKDVMIDAARKYS